MYKIFVENIEYLKEPKAFEDAYGSLPYYRQEKVRRIKNDLNKRQSVGAFVLLKKALDELNRNELLDKVAYTDRGKPYFLDCNDLYFSISHSGENVLCIVSDCPVGCDLQCMDKEPDDKLIQKVCSQEEYSYFSHLSSVEKKALFYTIWTRKESLVKLTGEGLFVDFSSLTAWPKLPQIYQCIEEETNEYKICAVIEKN